MQTTKKTVNVMLVVYPIADADHDPVFYVLDAKGQIAEDGPIASKRYRVKIEVPDYPVGDYVDLKAKAEAVEEEP